MAGRYGHRLNNRGGNKGRSVGFPQSILGEYSGKPRKRVKRSGENGKVKVLVPADPKKLAAWKEENDKFKDKRYKKYG